MNAQTTASQISLDDYFAAQQKKTVEEYISGDWPCIVDRIIEQKDLELRFPLSSEERMFLNAVLVRLNESGLSESIIEQDRAGFEEALLGLLEKPEIRRSKKMSRHIFDTWYRAISMNNFEFFKDTERIMADWALIVKYSTEADYI